GLQRREREQREQDEKRVQARRAEIAGLLKRARKAKSPDAAIALLRTALELDPENADAQESLAKYQEQRRDRMAGAATGAAGAARSKTLWRFGGLAAAIVSLIVVGYVVSQQPPAPTTSPVTTAQPPPVTQPTTVTPSPPTTTVPAAPPLSPSTVPPTTIPARGERGGQSTAATGRGRSVQPQFPPSTQSVPPTQLPPPTGPATTPLPPTPTPTNAAPPHNDDDRSRDDEGGPGRLNQRVSCATSDRSLLRRLPSQGLQRPARR